MAVERHLMTRYVQTKPAGDATQDVSGSLTVGGGDITLDKSGSAEFAGNIKQGAYDSSSDNSTGAYIGSGSIISQQSLSVTENAPAVSSKAWICISNS